MIIDNLIRFSNVMNHVDRIWPLDLACMLDFKSFSRWRLSCYASIPPWRWLQRIGLDLDELITPISFQDIFSGIWLWLWVSIWRSSVSAGNWEHNNMLILWNIFSAYLKYNVSLVYLWSQNISQSTKEKYIVSWECATCS